MTQRSGAQAAIAAAQHEAKIDAIRKRLLTWLVRAEEVEIVRETPRMKREDCGVLARMIPHESGEVEVVIKLSGVKLTQDDVCMLDSSGDRQNDLNWTIV